VNSIKDISAKTDASHIESPSSLSVHGLWELTKPRLSMLSVFTASLGYLVHYPLNPDLIVFCALTIGTALAAGGAAALNQWMEKDEDLLMPRTANRPIPAKLVEPEFALVFGVILSSIGLAILWIGTNPWACALTLLTLVVYLLFYTPLKKKSWLDFIRYPLHMAITTFHGNCLEFPSRLSDRRVQITGFGKS